MKKIILLDLNFTFAYPLEEKDYSNEFPRYYNPEKETYRTWLKEMIKDYYVILITTRWKKFEQRTLNRIQETQNWQPNEFYFNNTKLPAEKFKKMAMERYIIPKHGEHGKAVKYIAIESNSRTADMYRIQFGIYSRRQQDVKNDGRLEPKTKSSLFDEAKNT